MLAGCSFSSRHQMSTAQRLDIRPCGGFSKRGNRGDGGGGGAGDGRSNSSSTCSFRTHPAPPVTQAVSWGAKAEHGGGDGWGGEIRSSRAVKRAHEEEAVEEYGPVVRAKRTRMGGDGDEVWFHPSIAGTTMQAAGGGGEGGEEAGKVFLVPSAAAFPHGMAAAAGTSSLAAAKKEEYSKSPSSHSSSSSGGTDGGSSAIPLPLEVSARRSFVPEEREARELVGALTACAESLAACNHDAANFYLARLGETALPAGPTPLHRVAAYFAEALALRVVRMWPHVFDVSPPRELTDEASVNDDDAMALRVLNAVTPIPRFLHFTLNERLLRAFDGHDRVHVIDFDIKQGLQWPSLLQSLAARPEGPPAHVRITGVGESRQQLQETGARLACVAAALGLPFEFHTVVDRLEDVRLWMLHVKRGERVAVNCILAMHRLLRDETGAAMADFLGLARSTGASVLLLGEHEAAGLNTERWEARFARALRHYAAAFDAVDAAGLAPTSAARAKAEEMFAREIRNAVAFEGADRFERHESFGGWRRRMEDGGFRNAGIGDREAMQGRMIARMFAPPGRYSVQAQGDGEGLTLRWLDHPLYTVTAWTPAAGEGGSTVSASTTASHSQQS